MAVNIILALLTPKATGHDTGKGESTAEKRQYGSQKELWDEIHLTGLKEWNWNEQKEA